MSEHDNSTESPATEVAVEAAQLPERFRPWLPYDVVRGAVLGDFARLGMAGYVTQAACGFIPVVGTLCAARDLTADVRQRNTFGATLNALSLIPFLGGFPKTARVVRSIRDSGNAVQFSTNMYGAHQAGKKPHQP